MNKKVFIRYFSGLTTSIVLQRKRTNTSINKETAMMVNFHRISKHLA